LIGDGSSRPPASTQFGTANVGPQLPVQPMSALVQAAAAADGASIATVETSGPNDHLTHGNPHDVRSLLIGDATIQPGRDPQVNGSARESPG
jgi:hypothetical protein